FNARHIAQKENLLEALSENYFSAKGAWLLGRLLGKGKLKELRESFSSASGEVKKKILTILKESGESLEELDLSGMNLEGFSLAGAKLRKVNLAGANLAGANLEQANLSMANLENANLSGANLMGVTLTGAKLDGANFSHVIIGNTDLGGMNFGKVEIGAPKDEMRKKFEKLGAFFGS
ncbi:MAG: pentapeptide repeat-containing protein, partial [Planctomycetota bacterium]